MIRLSARGDEWRIYVTAEIGDVIFSEYDDVVIFSISDVTGTDVTTVDRMMTGDDDVMQSAWSSAVSTSRMGLKVKMILRVINSNIQVQ